MSDEAKAAFEKLIDTYVDIDQYKGVNRLSVKDIAWEFYQAGRESEVDEHCDSIEELSRLGLKNIELQAKLSQAKKANDELSERLEAAEKKTEESLKSEYDMSARLREAEKVIEFYGAKESWHTMHTQPHLVVILPSDTEHEGSTGIKFIGGKRARKYLEKYCSSVREGEGK